MFLVALVCLVFCLLSVDNITQKVITSVAKEVMVLVALVCLFVCGQQYSKSYEWIKMKFYGGVVGSTMKN